MNDIFGSVRRSLVFRPSLESEEVQSPSIGAGTLIDKLTSSIRKSRVFSKSSTPYLPPIINDKVPTIRWRKGELIGSGAFGSVYMGMNLDSGELLAVKQVLIASKSSSKEKAQAHIKELEEEVKLLKDLSHPNIVRYLGTVREAGSLNILLEFVPGGSISSLLGKFGAFPEAVIRMYTKQLLLGLEYLHKNGIVHRDIKGANILVDNKGCIKLADFGASKQVIELATISGAKSMKGTPYWMAPEVILQTGHSFSADIWSVGCTVIEMSTGKPPWSQQYQEVAALFHIGTTKSHPPIPEHLSVEAKDFLLKCLQKEPHLRSTASELLKHPFVTGVVKSQPACHASAKGSSEVQLSSYAMEGENFQMSTCHGSTKVCNLHHLRSSNIQKDKLGSRSDIWGTNNREEEMCQIGDKNDFMFNEVGFRSSVSQENFKSFNPMSEPVDDWGCKFDGSTEVEQGGMRLGTNQLVYGPDGHSDILREEEKDFSFTRGPTVPEDDDELTESRIREFLDEKAFELKKLQTPLYEEFYSSINTASSFDFVERMHDKTAPKCSKLPPKSRTGNRGSRRTLSTAIDAIGNRSHRTKVKCNTNSQTSDDVSSPPLNDLKRFQDNAQGEPRSSSVQFSEIKRKWKEELDQELETKREMMRRAGPGGLIILSPKHRDLKVLREGRAELQFWPGRE